MIERLRRINGTLQELLIGIVLFALLAQVSIVWFVERKLWYSGGLWSGAVLAMCYGVHMYRSLEIGFDCGEDAGKYLQKRSIQRYLIVVLVLGAMMVTELVNPLAAFLGLMGLKVAAYIQPFTHKWIHRKENTEA